MTTYSKKELDDELSNVTVGAIDKTSAKWVSLFSALVLGGKLTHSLAQPILAAVADDNHLAVKALARLGINVDRECNASYERPLHIAIYNGQCEMVKTLLECGADPNLPMFHTNVRPIHIAAEAGNDEIYNLLLKHGAKPPLRDGHGRTSNKLRSRNNQGPSRGR
jgi:ankyrin repeat protein